MPPHCVSLRNPQFVLSGLAFTINICSWSMFLLAEVASMRGEEPQRWVSSVGTGWHHNHPRQLFPCWWFSLLRQYWSGYRDLPWCESERHRTLGWNWSQGHSSHPALWHGTIASWDSPSPGIQNARIYYLYTPLPSTAWTTHARKFFAFFSLSLPNRTLWLAPHVICHKQEESGYIIPQYLQWVVVGSYTNIC